MKREQSELDKILAELGSSRKEFSKAIGIGARSADNQLAPAKKTRPRWELSVLYVVGLIKKKAMKELEK